MPFIEETRSQFVADPVMDASTYIPEVEKPTRSFVQSIALDDELPVEFHAQELLRSVRAAGMTQALVADDMREFYRLVCEEAKWTPKAWNIIAPAYTKITTVTKVYGKVDGRKVRVYPVDVDQLPKSKGLHLVRVA